MRSCIFSSDPHSSGDRHRRSLLLFALTFLPLLVAVSTTWRLYAPGELATPDTDRLLRNDDYYVAVWNSFHFDHFTLLTGARSTAGHYAAADVLFLGNSRMMFALNRDLLRAFFERRGLKYYLLGFGHGEGDRWAELIFERQHPHPKVVVVNADDFFNNLSPFGKWVKNMSAFERGKQEFEATAAMEVSRRLNRVLPHLNERDFGMTRKVVVLRSVSDGAWLLPEDFVSKRQQPFTTQYDPDETVHPARLRQARRFKALVEHQGARLVLMYVPHPPGTQSSTGRSVEILAEQLNVPLIAPVLEQPETFDGSHLTRKSAQRFTALFLNALEPVLPSPGPLARD